MMPDGSAGPGGADSLGISGDGRYVAFHSDAPLVPGDSGFNDVFVRDTQVGTTIRASVSFTNGQTDGHSTNGRLSADCRFVSFHSQASNIVPNDSNGVQDVFARDLVAGTSELVSLSSAGVQANDHSGGPASITPDARFVLFVSAATNLVIGDTNGELDVFVRDRVAGTTSRVSVDSAGNQANNDCFVGGISADGRFVVFESPASNLVAGDTNGLPDIFVHDRVTGATVIASLAANGAQVTGGFVSGAQISGDGRYVTFTSTDSDHTPHPNPIGADVFVRDLWLGTTRLVSIRPDGGSADAYSYDAVISEDGKVIVYHSAANNLAPYPSNTWIDLFAVRHTELSPAVYCTATTSSQGCVASMNWTGAPSATAGSGFVCTVSGLSPRRNAALLYSLLGPAAVPYPGGSLCLVAPLARTPIGTSQGVDRCSGVFAFDFNAWIAGGTDPALTNGQPVWIQCWSRDPLASATGTLNLSDAVFFVIDP